MKKVLNLVVGRIDQVLRKKLSISPSVCQRRIYAQING